MIRNLLRRWLGVTDNAPARRAFAIEPSDNHDLPHITRWIWVGRPGCLCVTMAGDSERVRIHLTHAGRLDIAVKKVWKCDTGCVRIVGFY